MAEAKAPEDLTEQDKMALLGRPKAGDITRAQLRIKESKEFKVSFYIEHRRNIAKLLNEIELQDVLCSLLNISAKLKQQG